MITLKPLIVAQAKNYYQAEPLVEAEWYGKAAKTLKLGTFKEKDYQNLIEGKDRGGNSLLKRNLDNAKRRAGTDCTFSAPKSVTLQAFVAGDDRLIAAHRQAVERTLEIIEREYATTKIVEEGKRVTITTGNLAIARFHHRIARSIDEKTDPDPHLHTHCVILNLTKDGDRWRYHANERLFKNQKYLRQVYGHYLGLECEKLGYRVVPHRAGKGEFEIEGIDRETIDTFSQRQKQILAFVSRWNVAYSVAREKTRDKKRKFDPEKLSALWTLRARTIGARFPERPAVAAATLPLGLHPDAREFAVYETGMERVVFTRESLQRSCLSLSSRPLDVATLQREIEATVHPLVLDRLDDGIAREERPLALDPVHLTTGDRIVELTRLARQIRKRTGKHLPELKARGDESDEQRLLLEKLATVSEGLLAVCLPSPEELADLSLWLERRLEEAGLRVGREDLRHPSDADVRLFAPLSPGELVTGIDFTLARDRRAVFFLEPRLLRETGELLPLPTLAPAGPVTPNRSSNWKELLKFAQRSLSLETTSVDLEREPSANPLPPTPSNVPELPTPELPTPSNVPNPPAAPGISRTPDNVPTPSPRETPPARIVPPAPRWTREPSRGGDLEL